MCHFSLQWRCCPHFCRRAKISSLQIPLKWVLFFFHVSPSLVILSSVSDLSVCKQVMQYSVYCQYCSIYFSRLTQPLFLIWFPYLFSRMWKRPHQRSCLRQSKDTRWSWTVSHYSWPERRSFLSWHTPGLMPFGHSAYNIPPSWITLACLLSESWLKSKVMGKRPGSLKI